MEQMSTEEVLEQLKISFPTIKIRAGSVGFGVFHGHKSMIFPYRVFQEPDFPDIFAKAVTMLEIMPCTCGHDSVGGDDWDLVDLIKI